MRLELELTINYNCGQKSRECKCFKLRRTAVEYIESTFSSRRRTSNELITTVGEEVMQTNKFHYWDRLYLITEKQPKK